LTSSLAISVLKEHIPSYYYHSQRTHRKLSLPIGLLSRNLSIMYKFAC